MIDGLKNPPNTGTYTPSPDLTAKVIKNTMIIDQRMYTSPPSYTGLGITDCIVKTADSSTPPVSVPKGIAKEIIVECLINDKIDENGGI